MQLSSAQSCARAKCRYLNYRHDALALCLPVLLTRVRTRENRLVAPQVSDGKMLIRFCWPRYEKQNGAKHPNTKLEWKRYSSAVRALLYGCSSCFIPSTAVNTVMLQRRKLGNKKFLHIVKRFLTIKCSAGIQMKPILLAVLESPAEAVKRKKITRRKHVHIVPNLFLF